MSIAKASVTVRALLGSRLEVQGLPITVLAGGSGLDRPITSPYPQKTGLALAGFDAYLDSGRLLAFADSEIRYLESLEPANRVAALRRAFSHDIPGVFLTGGLVAPPELTREADRAALPLLGTSVATPIAIARLTAVLEDTLSERLVFHAVLMDILGLGVLITGASGIGKSECALDLVVRGHRLVADDTVEIRRRAESVLIGTCPELTRHHMEVRGLGLINVRDLFGVSSTRSSKRIELVVQLERWEEGQAYERLGLDDQYYGILGLDVPLIRMPVAPGRNVAILVEVAARNQLLKARGHHAARRLSARLDEQLRSAEIAADDAVVDEDEGPGAEP